MEAPSLQRLIQCLGRLPGLGPRSGRRVALHLLKNPERVLGPLIELLSYVQQAIVTCKICGCLGEEDPCGICANPKRDPHTLCIVADMADVWALERAECYHGQYHVLGGLLSGIQGIGPEALSYPQLLARCASGQIQEIIFALSATVEGQTTAHYVMHQLRDFPHIQLSTLARGVPLGGELDYLDEGTLSTALESRRSTNLTKLAG
ncbi:MAG: recombination mediator RecR [Alphaproteobacteria bacterium]